MAKHWFHKRGGWLSFTTLDLHAMYGEFIGTVLFLLIGMAGVQATVTNLSMDNSSDGTSIQGSDAARLMGLFYISTSFGISLFAVASIFYRFTGSIFNPNVSFALCIIGAITPARFVLCAVAQIVGGIVAAAILDGLTPGPLSVSCQLGFGTTQAQVGTSAEDQIGGVVEEFCFASSQSGTIHRNVLYRCTRAFRFNVGGRKIAPLGFGFMLWAVELFSVEYTGGSINTARAFGPAVISGFTHYHWIYWLGWVFARGWAASDINRLLTVATS
ncbi:hypothetical protein QFC24_001034 [Naganishia onofrii]|uniref:Uncharacterized protein n=1 Tax=Naganishia onofrii TaxID=1851511 RepID=A0ACC2XVT9_9TREE|nr:hypothetical protein QFC24_001034 [Naganishia onofrii]